MVEFSRAGIHSRPPRYLRAGPLCAVYDERIPGIDDALTAARLQSPAGRDLRSTT